MNKRRFTYALAFWLLAAPLFAANVRWTGAAQDVRQVTTITVADTWATGDTATITCNNKSITVTVGSATSTSNVADILARAIDAANATEDLLGNETRNFGGEEIPEFAEIDASNSGAVLTLTSKTPGVPFTVTRSEVTAGDGTLGAVTAVTAATGKNWLSNAANYDTGTIPVDNDTLYIDVEAADILYALDHFRTNNIDLTVYVANSYGGSMGLPIQNVNGYVEYRTPRWFQFRGVDKSLNFVAGPTPADNAGDLLIDLQDQTGVTVNGESPRTGAVIYLGGAHASTFTNQLKIVAGEYVIEPDESPTATTKYAAFVDVNIGTPGGSTAAPIVTFGRKARLAIAGDMALAQHSGQLTLYPATISGSDDCLVNLYGGVLRIFATSCGQFNVYGGTLLPKGQDGTITEVNLYAGTLDASEATDLKEVTHLTLYAGTTVNDPAGLCVTTADFVGCRPDQVNLTIKANRNADFTGSLVP